MRKVLLAILPVLCLASIVGCRSVNRELTKIIYNKKPKKAKCHWYSHKNYTLTSSQMQEINFVGSIIVGDVNVCYQWGLGTQAECIANKTNELLGEVERRTGLRISWEAGINLLRFDEIPQNFSIEIESTPYVFRFPLFVSAGNESCEEIIFQNRRSYPGLLIHELVECSLLFSEYGGQILTDPEWRWFLFSGNYRNYTRWFREGFANYAGYLAYETMSEDKNFIATGIPLRQNIFIFAHPFSSLSKVGKKLFSWHQYSSGRLNHDYYNAALGLFLLIRNHFGEEAIREIISEIRKQDYLDGFDLVKLTNQTLNTDIKKLAESFHFPETGLKTKTLTLATALNEGFDITDGLLVIAVEPNSPAENANIKKEDVILKINNKPVRNHLDFELAIFELLPQRNVEVLIHRRAEGQVIAKLQLTSVN